MFAKFGEIFRQITAILCWINSGVPGHGLRTPRESFFSKIRNFWAWADKLGLHFMRHLGYFWPNYKHCFDTLSPLSMGKCSWFSSLQKTLVFRSKTYVTPKCYQRKILAVKNLGNSVHTSLFGEKDNFVENVFLHKKSNAIVWRIWTHYSSYWLLMLYVLQNAIIIVG